MFTSSHLQLYFVVFKINWDNLIWERIHDLGNPSIFIGSDSSISFGCSNVQALQNRLYYTHDLLKDVHIFS